MINTGNRIRTLKGELTDLRDARERARERSTAIEQELAGVVDGIGAASFDAFRGVAGAEKRTAELQKRRLELGAEMEKMAAVEEEAAERIAGAEDALAAAHKEANRSRLAELESRIEELDGEAQSLLQDAGEVLDTLASTQHEAASLSAEASGGGMPGPQLFMLQRQGFGQARDGLVRTHLGSHLLDLGGY